MAAEDTEIFRHIGFKEEAARGTLETTPEMDCDAASLDPGIPDDSEMEFKGSMGRGKTLHRPGFYSTKPKFEIGVDLKSLSRMTYAALGNRLAEVTEGTWALKTLTAGTNALVVDMEAGRIISDAELKQTICSAQPYSDWLNQYKIRLEELPEPRIQFTHLEQEQIFKYQKAFGYSKEDLDWLFCAIIADVRDKSNVARRSFFLNIILILFKINSGYSAPVVN